MDKKKVQSILDKAHDHISSADLGGRITYREEETLLAVYALQKAIQEIIKE